MTDSTAKELLLVFNEKAGSRKAKELAQAVGKILAASAVDLHTFLENSEEYLALAPQVIAAFGGDGTQFSVLNALQLSNSSAKLLPLGFGGENVLSRSMGLSELRTQEKVTGAVLKALFGSLNSVLARANDVELADAQTRNSNWMVNAGGVVVPILQQVEELRLAGASSMLQRYGGILRYLWRGIPSEPCTAKLEDGTEVLGYELAVVNDFLPNITGHFSVLQTAQRYQGENYLLVVGEHKLDVPKSSLVMGVLLDACVHALFGLPSITGSLTLHPLGKQSVTLAHQGSYVAIDSELYREKNGSLKIQPAFKRTITEVFTGFSAEKKNYAETVAQTH